MEQARLGWTFPGGNVTYRWRGHSKSDANRYRTRDEIEAWKEKCPINRFSNHLLKTGISQAEIDEVCAAANSAIDEAVALCRSLP